MIKEEKAAPVFFGTKEQRKKLVDFIEENRNMGGALMPILQHAQEIYGYLPFEVQKIVAQELDISLEEVYGVVTFYSQFSLLPKGKHTVSLCIGTACYVKGANDILERAKSLLGIDVEGCTEDGLFSLEATRCIGACGLAPVMMVDDDVYGMVKPGELEEIFAKYN